MKINFKKPKYVIPLIALPFIALFYYTFSQWKGKNGKTVKTAVDSSKISGQINTDMPGVSGEVAKCSISDKYKAYLQAYKDTKDQSALNGIENKSELQKETEDPLQYQSAYSEEDIRKIRSQKTLDSLKKILDNNKKEMDKRMSSVMNRNNAGNAAYNNSTKSPEEIIASLSKNKKENNVSNGTVDNNRSTDKLLSYLDEIRKKSDTSASLNPPFGGRGGSSMPHNVDPSKDSSFKPLPVSFAHAANNAFNTARFASPDFNIKAIIDEDEKAFAGTRIRIRLLDDIIVGNNVISKGAYIYGQVSGFQTQRVNISITQILYNNEVLPVKLDVFDNDGYLGLYVPGSNFREFSKEIGTQGTSGLSSIQTSSGSNDVTTGILMKLFQTTTSSAGKLIKQDKVFLKYNHIIILKEKK